ncbi:LAMI_0F04786g1_1 [Lachancea mirantina]|uniref:LAMI_0F04786g1_1 n=1 Tax=Lachancea mirantina TaxID=1230905 RepID=A0A1G4JY60_9SACH|nr:LAMI_0F04786g1_1 [Lachancea mirantina]
MSKHSSAEEDDVRRPQERMNEYLSDPDLVSIPSDDQPQNFPSESRTTRDRSDSRDDGYHYNPRADFHPNHTISASSSYIPNLVDGFHGFPVQEVIPSTQLHMHKMHAGSSGGHSSGYRSRAGTGASGMAHPQSLRSRATSSAHPGESRHASHDDGEVGEDGDTDQDHQSVPMMVRPKALYQNPQTPSVLPSSYHPINKWSSVKHYYLKEILAEFLGTLVMMFFGCAVSCQVKLGQQNQKNVFLKQLAESNIPGAQELALLQNLVLPDPNGTFDDIAFCWAGAVVMGYFASGGSAISGAHLNPSITITNCIFRGFPWVKAPFYLAGQVAGSYAGSLIIFIYYKRVIQEVFPDWQTNESVAGMFCTVPLAYLSTTRQFVGEYVIGAFLQCGIFALTDPYTCLSSDLFPLWLFILIYCLNASVSLQTAAALNAARDIGPRLALYTVGVNRSLLWSAHRHFFWIPLVAPFVGAITGAIVYDISIYRGHESPLNWPLNMYKEKLLRAWIRRPRFYKRDRKRSSSSLSDWAFDEDAERSSSRNSEEGERPRRDSLDHEPIQKVVQFKSLAKNTNARRNHTSGIPTIFEEPDDDEDDDSSSSNGEDLLPRKQEQKSKQAHKSKKSNFLKKKTP